jgi:membrane-associated protease RseP (regulator of RpoE activity)
MTSPRHLWSGEWERDSASLEAELAARERLQVEDSDAGPAGVDAPPEASEYTPLGSRIAAAIGAAFAALFRGLRRLNPRAVALALIVAAVVVAGAFALNAIFGGSSKHGGAEASLSTADALFGVQLSTGPNRGVVIETVRPGGPAELAGLDPGDALTAIDNRPVSDANSVAAAVKDLHVGNEAVLQVSRGSAIISTLLTLTHP